MIVMKFGGTSTASADAIRQIAVIVQREIRRRPVVVVSAMGDTTDRLLGILQKTALSQTAESSYLQRELLERYLNIAGELLTGVSADCLCEQVQRQFRDLHVRMLEVNDAERAFDSELKDWVVSLGEQLSSMIVAAAFNNLGIATTHLDSRQLIRTDDRFTDAKPRFWETYSRLRWAASSTRYATAAVMGGFIGSTSDGRTTTLGRGGSDLTASIVGAALNAEEIQVWKDVDGMLTCDPRLHPGGLCLRSLTFAEAEHLAQAGAKILHPDTIAPARRLRIPIFLRNTFRPQVEGTRIFGETTNDSKPVVKSVAFRKGLQLLRIRPRKPAVSREELFRNVEASLSRQRVKVTLLGQTDQDIVLAIDGTADFSQLVFGFEGCLQVHLQANHALLTLVGDGIANSAEVKAKLNKTLGGLKGALMLPSMNSAGVLRVAVAEKDSVPFLARLHTALFSNADPSVFESANAAKLASDPMETLQDVASAIAKSNGTTVWAGHRVLALAERT